MLNRKQVLRTKSQQTYRDALDILATHGVQFDVEVERPSFQLFELGKHPATEIPRNIAEVYLIYVASDKFEQAKDILLRELL